MEITKTMYLYVCVKQSKFSASVKGYERIVIMCMYLNTNNIIAAIMTCSG